MGMEATADENHLHRDLKKSKSSDDEESMAAELAACEARLDAESVPSFLYVQMANQCKLSRTGLGNATQYYLSSQDMDDETYSFTDRPFQIEDTMTTVDFFDTFDQRFNEASGGRPNAAMTFHHADDQQMEGPLIAIQVEAVFNEENGEFVYALQQSESQASIVALGQFFEEGNAVLDGEVVFDDCSIFIDSDEGTCGQDGCGGDAVPPGDGSCQWGTDLRMQLSDEQQFNNPPGCNYCRAGKCVNKLPNGADAARPNDCRSNSMYDGKCTGTLKLGESCVDEFDCDLNENDEY
ncbi:MAG: hypothetical protein SGARI_003037, partial [Bacillariaceae sp.]